MNICTNPSQFSLSLSIQLRQFVLMAVIGASAGLLSAATIIRSGTLVVEARGAALGSAFEIGDVFQYTLSYDDSVLDMESDPDYGEFLDAITALTIMPESTRTGIWSPTGSFGTGTVFTERGSPQSWSYVASPNAGLVPPVNGYSAALFYMGFGGLPDNYDTGGNLTLGGVTGSILNSVSMGSDNIVELSFESGVQSHIVTFELINFHAPEPGRTVLVLSGLTGAVFKRRRR